jgi:hypothetical protein
VADWYRSTILEAAWGFPPERFRSQDFWEALEQILPEGLILFPAPKIRGTRPSSGCSDCGKNSRW